MSPSNTRALISLLAESAERVGFKMEASPIEASMYRVRRAGSPRAWSSNVGIQK
jgi:hypothetical protein